MTRPDSDVARGPRRWVTAGAIVWALAFAVLHVAWAAGSRVLIDDRVAADEAFGWGWFQAYNAIVVVGSVIAAGIVVAAGRLRSRRGRRWARRLLWLAAALLVVRGGIGAVQLLHEVATNGRSVSVGRWSVDGLMLVGGTLFAAVALGRPAVARDGHGTLAHPPTD